MSVQVLFAQYAKRNNSTSRFTDHRTEAGGTVVVTELSCFLKEATDSENPIIRIQVDFVPTDFNVCYIYGFNRYYWIRKWEYNRTEWHAYCEIDALATMREEIRNASFYVLRVDRYSNNINEFANDKAYSLTQKIENIFTNNYIQYGESDPFRYRVESISQGPLLDPFYLESYPNLSEKTISGYISMGIISTHDVYASPYMQSNVDKMVNTYGSVKYYVFTPRSLQVFLQNFVEPGNWQAFLQGSNRLEITNPLQYISQAYFIPKQLNLNPLKYVDAIQVGWRDFPLMYTYDSSISPIIRGCTSISQAVVVNNVVVASQTIYSIDERHVNLKDHPQLNRGRYLNYSPYRSIHLCIGTIGTFEIPTDRIPQDANSLRFRFIIDNITGKTVILVNAEQRIEVNDHYIYLDVTGTIFSSSVDLGYQIQIAQISANVSEMTTSTLGTIGNIISSIGMGMINPVLGVGSLISNSAGIMNIEEAASAPELSTKGNSAPSLANYYIDPYVRYTFKYIVGEDFEETGRICCETLSIANMRNILNQQYYGYLKVLNGDFQSIYTQHEKDIAKSYLESGFFFEE